MNDPDSTVVRSRPAPAVDPDATVVRPVMQRPPEHQRITRRQAGMGPAGQAEALRQRRVGQLQRRMQAARARHDPLERRRVDTAGHQRDPHRHHVQQLQVAAVEAAVERAVLVPFVRVLARRSLRSRHLAAGPALAGQATQVRPQAGPQHRPGRAGPHRGHDPVKRGVTERTQTQGRAGRLQVGVRRLQPGPGGADPVQPARAGSGRHGTGQAQGVTGVGHHRGRIVQAPHGPP